MTRPTTSASNIFRRELCPGSHAAEAQFPQLDESPDAMEGTLLHAMDADKSLDRSALTPDQEEVLARAEKIDEEIFSAIRTSLELPEDEPYSDGCEETLILRRGLRKVLGGHCDRWRFYPGPKVLAVIDKKFGRREVIPAESNMQLRSYAVMGAEDTRWKPDNILVAINQPRMPFGGQLTMAEYTRVQIPDAKAHLLRVIDASQVEGAPRIAGEEQCRYCSAKLHCDAYRAKYAAIDGVASDGKEVFIAKLARLSDEQLDRVWVAIGFAETVKDTARTEIERRLEAGQMDNYELRPTGNMSTVTDNIRAVELLRGIGFTDTEVLRRAKLKLDELSDDIREREGLTIKAAKVKLRDTLAPVLDIKPKSPALKRVADCQPTEGKALPLGDELFPA